MKYIILILTFIPVISVSQNLFTEDKLWTTMTGPGGDCDQFYCWSYYTKITGDTVIDSQFYKIVSNCNDSLMIDWYEVGYIREVGEQVFYRKKDVGSECLLYDFGCNVGDTLNINCWCPEQETFFKVDSIVNKLALNENRKHIYLSYLNNSSKELWIEGIGSIGGILNGGGPNNCMTGGSQNLLCCYENGKEIYHDSDYQKCFLGSKNFNSINETRYQKKFHIYPNPANEEITIYSQLNTEILSVQLIDLTGNYMYRNDNVQSKSLKLKVDEFPKGIYILTVETIKEKISRRVVVY